MIPVKWDNKEIDVLIDTGADPSVLDRDTVERMEISYTAKEDRVYGLGRASLAVCGTSRVSIDLGHGQPVDHLVEVLDTNARSAIL